MADLSPQQLGRPYPVPFHLPRVTENRIEPSPDSYNTVSR